MTNIDEIKQPHLYERVEGAASQTSYRVTRLLWRVIFWSGALISACAILIAITSNQFFWVFWIATSLWGVISLPCLCLIVVIWFYSSQITEIKENIDMIRTLDAESFAKNKTQELLQVFLIFIAILIGLIGYAYFSFPDHRWILWVGGMVIAIISLIFWGLYSLLRRQIKRLPMLQEKAREFAKKHKS